MLTLRRGVFLLGGIGALCLFQLCNIIGQYSQFAAALLYGFVHYAQIA